MIRLHLVALHALVGLLIESMPLTADAAPHYAQITDQSGSRVLAQVGLESSEACQAFLTRQSVPSGTRAEGRFSLCVARPNLRAMNYRATVQDTGTSHPVEIEALTIKACEAGLAAILHGLSKVQTQVTPCAMKKIEMQGAK